jgi:hypothetical protein
MAAIPVPRRRLRLGAVVLASLVLLPVRSAMAAGPATGPAARTAAEASASRPFRIDLAEDGDYVRQYTFVQCVGASVQMMLNIAEPGADRSRRLQRRLQVLARATSGPRPDGGVRQGAGVFGWATALNRRGAGPYEVVGADSLQEAMRIAARAIVTHRRPVGLLVWKGRHAWVMSGFEATGDPRRGPFRVTRATILDPLYPHGSEAWGPSPVPGRSISVREVGRQFVHRDLDSRWNSLPRMEALRGRWVLVVPTAPATTDDATGEGPGILAPAPEPATAPPIVLPLPPRPPDPERNF